ncbi:adhesion G protein-coupled receptor E2-like isoform X3 [Planococcus citri]
MCDEKCPTYGDCCKDSIYYNLTTQRERSFTCESSFLDGYIYMISKCPTDYVNPTMVKNCKTTNRRDLVENFLLSIPVSNVAKNITYKNAYCAICNYETEFEFWQPLLYIIEEPTLDIIQKNASISSSTDQNLYNVINHTTILSNMKMNENHTQLVSVVEGRSYLCYIVPNMQTEVASASRFCFSDSNDRLCSDCEKGTPTNSCVENLGINLANILELTVHESRFPKIFTCDDVPDDVDKKLIFCEPNIEHCFYKNPVTKELCLVNRYLEVGEYEFREDGSVYVKESEIVFPPEQYTNDTSTTTGGIFVCGTEIPMSNEDKFFTKLRDTLTEIFIKLSIFFLILYLAVNVNKQKLQSLPNKILFSFCFTLLLLYVVFEVAQLLKSCIMAAAIIHYLYLSCIMWLLIASYDFWQVICLSSTKLQTLAGKTRLKRYLLYCFFGWISPCFIMAIAIYFELALNRIIPCNLKPGYGRLKQCFIGQDYPKFYFLLYPTTVIFCIILALFAHTSYHIYLSKRKNIKSTAQNNYYLLFVKLALSMGITWTLGLLVTYIKSNFISTIYVTLNASHGILMFFAYCFKSTMLTKMYEKHKNTSIVQQTRSTFFSITDKIKNPASQSTTSIDPVTQEMESTH